jgi:hypothetical protein
MDSAAPPKLRHVAERNTIYRMTHRLRLLTLISIAISALPADERPAVSYPEHGTIISSQTVRRIYRRSPDPSYHGVHHVDIVICRIETVDRTYELKGPPIGSPIGNEVQFRLKKKDAYVQVGTGEQRYEITSVRMKPGP